jgi:uncharacterized membrane protein
VLATVKNKTSTTTFIIIIIIIIIFLFHTHTHKNTGESLFVYNNNNNNNNTKYNILLLLFISHTVNNHKTHSQEQSASGSQCFSLLFAKTNTTDDRYDTFPPAHQTSSPLAVILLQPKRTEVKATPLYPPNPKLPIMMNCKYHYCLSLTSRCCVLILTLVTLLLSSLIAAAVASTSHSNNDYYSCRFLSFCICVPKSHTQPSYLISQ